MKKKSRIKKAKAVSESETLLSGLMMPVHANHYGSIHGGTILKLADEAAFVAASKHARKNVVMASMDQMIFENPVNVGDMLKVTARLCYVGKSSMDVEIEIKSEKLKEAKTVDVGSAYFTMVALDDEGRPAEVPRLRLDTKLQKAKSKQAIVRRKQRLST